MTDQQLKIQLKNESGTGVSASFISVKISVNFILALNVVSLYHTPYVFSGTRQGFPLLDH